MSTTIGDRIRALREMHGMTGEEVSAIGGLKNASQVSKVENGHNLATTIHMRVSLAKGFGLTLDEFNSFLEERMTVQQAHKIGFPRLSPKLRALRESVDMSHQAELEEAIAQVQVSPGVIELAREIAAGGRMQTVERWKHTLHYLQNVRDRALSGKIGNGE